MILVNFFNCPFKILFEFLILMQGKQLAFEFHLSIQKMRENHSSFLIVPLYALEAFQEPLESSSLFSKENRGRSSIFKKCERIPVYSTSNRKKEKFKKCERIRPKKEGPIS